MQPQGILPRLNGISRWLVPLAAVLAIAAWIYIAPPGILGKADAIGYAVCHRIDERSFHVDGRQLPLCARCSGMYLGALLGLVVLLAAFLPASSSISSTSMAGWCSRLSTAIEPASTTPPAT